MPKFTDHCEHGEEAFVTTISEDGQEYDIYRYTGDSYGPRETHVCLRYGEEGFEYLSPGPLRYVRRMAECSALYRRALEIVEAHG